MLTPDNNRDINIFAIQSLDPLVNDAVKLIMQTSDRFMACFNITEMYTLPFEIQEGQFKIIQALSRNLTKERAIDAIKGNGIARLMKAYNYTAPNYQSTLAEFIASIVDRGRSIIDIPTIISMVLCPFPAIQNIGV